MDGRRGDGMDLVVHHKLLDCSCSVLILSCLVGCTNRSHDHDDEICVTKRLTWTVGHSQLPHSQLAYGTYSTPSSVSVTEEGYSRTFLDRVDTRQSMRRAISFRKSCSNVVHLSRKLRVAVVFLDIAKFHCLHSSCTVHFIQILLVGTGSSSVRSCSRA